MPIEETRQAVSVALDEILSLSDGRTLLAS